MLTLKTEVGEKVYGLSLQAYHLKRNRVEHSAWIVMAMSLDGAEEQGMVQAFKLWPKENGWERHDASAIEAGLVCQDADADWALDLKAGKAIPEFIM